MGKYQPEWKYNPSAARVIRTRDPCYCKGAIAQYNELKRRCDEQTLAHEKAIAETG